MESKKLDSTDEERSETIENSAMTSTVSGAPRNQGTQTPRSVASFSEMLAEAHEDLQELTERLSEYEEAIRVIFQAMRQHRQHARRVQMSLFNEIEQNRANFTLEILNQLSIELRENRRDFRPATPNCNETGQEHPHDQ